MSNYEHDPTTLLSGNPVKYVKSGGGAILFNGQGNNVVGCNFTDCWTKFKGGVIYFIEGNNTVSDCNFFIFFN